jgi:hypothetical protein
VGADDVASKLANASTAVIVASISTASMGVVAVAAAALDGDATLLLLPGAPEGSSSLLLDCLPSGNTAWTAALNARRARSSSRTDVAKKRPK